MQLSIISESGKKLFDSYFRPLHRSWSAAQAVNNISPDMVANAPSIAEKAAEIQRILNSADTIIGYNTSFDADFITAAGLIIPKRAEIVDIIQCSPLEDDSLSLNAQYVFCCLVLNDGSLVVDHPIIAAGLDELIRHGYLSNEGDIDAAKDIQQTFSRFNGTEWQETD